jgi:heme/copper-type cytochrome/quinol oxidase subunit 4
MDESSKENDTGAVAHEHASKRLLIGFGALVLLSVVGFLIWLNWGAEIKESCFGENGVCSVDLKNVD